MEEAGSTSSKQWPVPFLPSETLAVPVSPLSTGHHCPDEGPGLDPNPQAERQRQRSPDAHLSLADALFEQGPAGPTLKQPGIRYPESAHHQHLNPSQSAWNPEGRLGWSQESWASRILICAMGFHSSPQGSPAT